MKRLAGIYVRISSDPTGKARGVRDQEKDCRDLAKRKGWEVVAVFNDNDISASNRRRKRPAWMALLEALQQGEINAVIGDHPDRFYRQMRDLEDLIELIENRDIAVETVSAGLVDLGTASGRLVARNLAAVNRHESERISERLRARWRHTPKAPGGSRRAFGYTADWKVNRKEAALIKSAAKRLIGGESCYRICLDWNAKGITTPYGNKWHPSKMVRMFTGKHMVGDAHGRPAILSEDEHRLILAALGDRPKGNVGRPSGRRYAATGLLVCSKCDDKLTGRSGQYICPQGHMGITATYVERHLAEIATIRSWNEETTARRKTRQTTTNEAERKTLKELEEIERRFADVEKEIAAGKLPARSGGRILTDLERRREQLQSTIRGHIERKETKPKTFKELTKIGADFDQRWSERKLTDAEMVELQELLRAMFKVVKVYPAKTPSKKGFDPSRLKAVMRP